jgi:hypothetical protein
MKTFAQEVPTRVENETIRPFIQLPGGFAGLGTYLLVAAVAGSSLGLELIQTRVLSFLYFNHVVYLTVTVALLGFGISGVFVSLFASRSARPERAISLLAAGFVVSSFACLALVSRIPGVFPHASTISKLVVSYLVLTIPFLFSGGVLGWVFMAHAKSINRMYAVDLACSSGAVVAFLLLLWPLGGDWFLWLCSGVALAGFLVFSRGVLALGWKLAPLVIYLMAMILVGNHLIGTKPELYKILSQAYDRDYPGRTVETTQWTPITRIDVWSDPVRSPDWKMITQDGDAVTMLFGPQRVAWALEKGRRNEVMDRLFMGALSLTYRFNPTPQDALVIGVGGGVDMLMARAYGARHITGVEINQATVALDKGKYSDYLLWPKWDDVKLIRTEGRNYVRSKPGKYDTVVMSGVDTFAALNSGAYVLSENYLYTVEAVQDYLNALKPNGTMAIYRWLFMRPRESVRLASLFIAASERMGIPHPEQRIMVVSEDVDSSQYRWAATFIKKEPFTPEQVRDAASAIASNPRLSILYMPKVFEPEVQAEMESKEAQRDPSLNFARDTYNHLLVSSAAERLSFIRSYEFRIDPVYDDRPFFFEYYKPGADAGHAGSFGAQVGTVRGPAGYYVPYILLVVCGIVCAGCILFPLWTFQRRGLQVAGVVPLLLYFACLGFGYMLFEVGAMQVLNVYLGDPAYSLAIVLAGLLLASGIGAAVSGQLARLGAARVICYATVCIGAAMILWLGINRTVHPATMRLPLLARASIVLAGLLPVGIIMGMPFPTAIRKLETLYPNFIAWAWGVNGVTSVLASIVAIIVAMRFGFTVVVCMAAATYFLAMMSYRWHTRSSG